ncbi:MAG TPA: hypothetical protein VGJ05_07930 [Fimbriiglobus sp.]
MNVLRAILLLVFCCIATGCTAIDNDPVLGSWDKPARPKGSAFKDMVEKQ